MLVLQSAGNLATTQSVISLLSARIRTQQEPNLMQVTSLYDAAMLIGKVPAEAAHEKRTKTLAVPSCHGRAAYPSKHPT